MSDGKLTAEALRRAHAADGETTLSDGGPLHFRKRKGGGASWVLRRDVLGVPREIQIGTYPDMTLREARLEARKAGALLDQLENPTGASQSQSQSKSKRNSNSGSSTQRKVAKKDGPFSALCERWFRSEILGRGLKNQQDARGALDRYILPSLGRLVAAEIGMGDITLMLEGVKLRYPARANQLLRITRRIFTFGVRQGLVSSNPTFDMTHRQDAGGTDRERTRALSLEELVTLFAELRDTQGLGQENRLALKLLLALGVRKGELVAARWEEFDQKGRTVKGPVWHLPGVRTKNGQPLDIPLAPPVVGWFGELRGLAGESEWVFPRRRRDDRDAVTAHAAANTLNAALARVEHELEHFTLEDLRRTTRRQLRALGFGREVVEKCLGHRYRGIDGTYDEKDYFEERRVALAQWAEVLRKAGKG